MLFTTKSRTDKPAPDLDSSQFGHFGNLTKPYKDAERKELDRERYLQTLTNYQRAPVRLLEEAVRIQANLNRLKMKPEKREQLTQAVLGQIYPVVAMWYEKFQAEQSSLPESNERRNALEASIKAVEQVAISYKLLFHADYNASPSTFARHQQQLYAWGLRIIELLRLIQRLKALRYQKMSKTDWLDVNQVFFSMLLHNAVNGQLNLLGTVGVRSRQDKSERSSTPKGSMQEIYLSIQLFGLLETNSWPTGMLYVPDAYLASLGTESFQIKADDRAPLQPGTLVTYLHSNGPPQFQRREDIGGPSILIDYTGLYNALVREHETIGKMKFLGNYDASKLSKPLQVVKEEERLPVLESMLIGLRQRNRQQKRHRVHTYDALRVYFGREEVMRLLRDISSRDLQKIMDSRQFVDKLARQSSLLAEDDRSHMVTQWAMINFSSGGLLIGTEETAFSTPIKIGQLVAFGPVDAELHRVTLGYINRLHRTDDHRVEVAIVRLSTHAEAVVIQNEKDMQEKSGHAAILVKDLDNQWKLIVTPGLEVKSGDPLKLIRNDGSRLPVRLGEVWIVKKEFTQYELRSPGLE
ncbi:MAG: hypothetical protein RI563_10645 [Thiohalophilus sp.]|uniref:hypothetical protein n=1 Tax=Thiohalophilus sp. TaxID=3028392 RepID=UPI00287094F6|nr:hypothetical protein [Thiohalophilus sp.]MDR9437334.1 hypothetical protein [Thiohalophilus sp.]